MNNKEYLTSQVNERYENNNLGDPIGLTKIDSGHNRIVYRVTDSTYGSDVKGMVIKVQYPNSFENKEEFKVWERYKNTRFEKYLVPIKEHSYDFSWILMPYGESVPESLLDEELMNQLYDLNGSDVTKDDFVYMDGNFARQRCCDYASL